MRTRWIKLLAPIAAFAIVAGACGGDDDDGGDAAETAPATAEGSSEETAATTVAATAPATSAATEETSAATDPSSDDPLGTPNPASGDPVKIGLITEEGGAGGGAQGSQTSVAFDIAAQYINEYQGGIAGHPIEIWECGNSSTPAGAQDCAQQAVEQNVVAVVLPFDCCGDDQVPIVVGAGIPYVVASGSANSHLTTPGAFSLAGGYVASLGAVAKHASEQGCTKVTHIVIDVPSAVGAATDIGGLVFANAGVDYEVVTVAPGTPDMTPQLSAAGDAALMVTGDITFCTSFNQAYDTLGLSNPKYQIPTCVDPSVLESLPDAYDGTFLPTTITNEGADADLYAAIVEKYGDGSIDPDPIRSGTVATPLAHLINFSRMLDGIGEEVTAETVMAQLKAAKDVPMFLADGATATCDGTAIPSLPNVCSSSSLMATLDAEAQPTSIEPIDLTGLFTPPG